MNEQHRGIDRWFTCRAYDKLHFSVEYKLDVRSGETGNVFMEYRSKDTTGATGGVMRSEAKYYSILCPKDRLILWCSTQALRLLLPSWLIDYGSKDVPNDGYLTSGVPVPRRVLTSTVGCLRIFKVGAQLLAAAASQ